MANVPPATDLSAIDLDHPASPVYGNSETVQQVASRSPTDEESETDSLAKLKPGSVYPSASPGQQLLLDVMNDDVLIMVVEVLFDIDGVKKPWLYYDKPYFRCHSSTLNLSLVSRRLRSICIPKLFRDIFRLSTTMGQLNRQLKDIELNGAVLSCVRTCEIVTSSRFTSVLCKTRLPKVLYAMDHLTQLSITHRKDVDFSAVEKTFMESNVSLASVVGLRIQCAGDWHFLVKACPNTEKLILRDSLHCNRLMEAAGELKKLQHLELFSDTWIEEAVHYLQELVPNIESLALKGEILNEEISNWGEIFGEFQNLHTLAVTTLQCIPDSEIESQMTDDSDVARNIIQRRRDYHEEPGDEAQELIAEAYFGCCPTLDRLYLVDWEYPTAWGVTRSSDGSVEAVDYLGPDEPTSYPISYKSTRTHRAWLDGDGFPMVLSFPREILTSRTDQDPPNYGRESKEEREATAKEKNWYMERWHRYHNDT